MKIVTYNVNGLRPRIQQFGSLLKLLSSLDADIICFQETKLAKHDLRADMVWADGYESFFSCTRARIGYSGVATFCRVKSAFSSGEVALPVDAEEGFTGLLENSRGFGDRKDDCCSIVEGLEEFSKDELLKVDSEGRCIITDHGHFVLFNIYGPCADPDDVERIQFKHNFFKILKKRWDALLGQGRRLIVVGDINIAPATIDRCDAKPDFEKNKFREWFRSLLIENGGPFTDVFRAKHPERKEAYTCWSTSSGAEIFNFGSRIDHILSAGECLHEHSSEGHDFLTCHVRECEILTQFKRWQSGKTTGRWKGGAGIKLKGSDHAPVCMSLDEIPIISQHNTPLLSTRYCPQVEGCQQTLVSMLARRQTAEQIKSNGQFDSSLVTETVQRCKVSMKRSSDDHAVLDFSLDGVVNSPHMKQGETDSELVECPRSSPSESSWSKMLCLSSSPVKPVPRVQSKKKPKQCQGSQLSLRSFFQKSSNSIDGISQPGISDNSGDLLNSDQISSGDSMKYDETNTKTPINISIQDHAAAYSLCSTVEEKRNVAVAEWQRIQEVMQNSIPLCKGHNEPCVARIVRKAGPNLGRKFFVCARAEGPASNPEANCNYFKWAASKSKHKERGQ
ncbi:DNA-(apurinic or apyrimidinic site) endonuclease 2 isoform X1 [Apium graveolens]|uniref:DNA-(apurinic or apyrimidinic site) endonuclease 2 isoform X1 n=1 Tax=Apium graveolens TaxID=4045 RepID=UPI003D7B397B